MKYRIYQTQYRAREPFRFLVRDSDKVIKRFEESHDFETVVDLTKGSSIIFLKNPLDFCYNGEYLFSDIEKVFLSRKNATGHKTIYYLTAFFDDPDYIELQLEHCYYIDRFVKTKENKEFNSIHYLRGKYFSPASSFSRIATFYNSIGEILADEFFIDLTDKEVEIFKKENSLLIKSKDENVYSIYIEKMGLIY